jgi:predicted AlkP superfamily pyrophosphatase or phosphodiesterase
MTRRAAAGWRLWLARCCAGLLLAIAVGGQAASTTDPTVIVLSWDGLRHDYPDQANLPSMARIAQAGVRAGRLIPVFPANTFPGHVSLATGTYPDRHGIVDNHFIDRLKGTYRYAADADWLDAEPLWIAAERQGVPAATYFWVGSESDWRGQGTRYRMAPFDASRPEAAKVDQIVQWLRLPAEQRPRLIMSYWAGADRAGHRHGPDSPEVRAALVAQDAELGRLLAALDEDRAWSHTTLMLVSDHGMTETGRYLDLAGALRSAGVPARVVGSAVAHVYLENPAQIAAAEVAARTLGKVKVYRGAALPDHYRLRHPTRTGDLVVMADPPYTLSRPAGFEGRLMTAMQALGSSFGTHGYDPALPDMGAVFMAMGRGIPAGLTLGEVRQIDVAATVARLLGIEPPLQSEGLPIPGMGEP